MIAKPPRLPEATAPAGLTSAEAGRRLLRFGPNELPRAARRSLAGIVLGVLREPMFLLLALAAVIYLAIGGLGEGLLMAAFAGLSIALVVVQESRSENAIEALRALATPMARVVRDGGAQRIAAREVVPGDLLLIADGERVAADAVLRRAENLAIDESLLTGESVPVAKLALADDPPNDEAGETSAVYAGTLVTSGRGLAEVTSTGAKTEAGRIGASLASIEIEPTLLQRSFGRLVRLFAVLALVGSLSVVVLYGVLRGTWLQGVLSGIAFGMSAVPEEFPMVLVVFVALGARRLARLHVLARRTAVIEVLGACSTLCVDKTGTLTENRMRVCGLAGLDERLTIAASRRELPPVFASLLRIAARASARTSNDPMDQAVHRLAEEVGERDGLLSADTQPVREYGLTPERPAIVRVWRTADDTRVAVAKGAPECIAGLCRLSAGDRTRLLDAVEHYAKDGVRVLALATCTLERTHLPDSPAELGLQLAGIIAFADPLRQGASQAIAAARRAGVRVVMITGDYPATAMAIAREAGIDCSAGPLSGEQISQADDDRLRELVRTRRIFARVRPDQKLRIVRALKDNGEIVAMTGDGVNDAPALKAAHIGLAMGGRGTDVAREAASIVLLQDDLTHLIAGIEMGRRIFDNLRKASVYIAAIHVPIAGLTLLPLLIGLPPLLLPLHVVLIEMVIDPICAIAFENEPVEPGTMEQPPRRPNDPLLGWPQLGLALAQGILLLVAALGIYVVALGAAMQVDEARALAFVGFTAGNLMLIRVTATRGPTLYSLGATDHRAYWVLAGIAALVTALCVSVPSLSHLFQFATPHPGTALLAVLTGLASALVFDAAKSLPDVQRILGRSAARGDLKS